MTGVWLLLVGLAYGSDSAEFQRCVELAKAAAIKGSPGDAQKAVKAGVKVATELTEVASPTDLAKLYVYQGMALQRAGKKDAALDAWRAAHRLDRKAPWDDDVMNEDGPATVFEALRREVNSQGGPSLTAFDLRAGVSWIDGAAAEDRNPPWGMHLLQVTCADESLKSAWTELDDPTLVTKLCPNGLAEAVEVNDDPFGLFANVTEDDPVDETPKEEVEDAAPVVAAVVPEPPAEDEADDEDAAPIAGVAAVPPVATTEAPIAAPVSDIPATEAPSTDEDAVAIAEPVVVPATTEAGDAEEVTEATAAANVANADDAASDDSTTEAQESEAPAPEASKPEEPSDEDAATEDSEPATAPKPEKSNKEKAPKDPAPSTSGKWTDIERFSFVTSFGLPLTMDMGMRFGDKGQLRATVSAIAIPYPEMQNGTPVNMLGVGGGEVRLGGAWSRFAIGPELGLGKGVIYLPEGTAQVLLSSVALRIAPDGKTWQVRAGAGRVENFQVAWWVPELTLGVRWARIGGKGRGAG